MTEEQKVFSRADRFMMMVQTAATISYRTTDTYHDPIYLMTNMMVLAFHAAENLPEDVFVSDAVMAFVRDNFPDYAEVRSDRRYRAPDWLRRDGVGTASQTSETESLIDGVWQPENPDWRGLPGDSSRYLRLLAFIRSVEEASPTQIEQALPDLNPRVIGKLLKEAAAEDLVASSGTGVNKLWRATLALRKTDPDASSRKAEVTRTEDSPRRRPKADRSPVDHPKNVSVKRVYRINTNSSKYIMRKLDAYKIHRTLIEAGKKGLNITEIRISLPEIDYHRLRGLLNKLRGSGDVKLVGSTSMARWYAANTRMLYLSDATA